MVTPHPLNLRLRPPGPQNGAGSLINSILIKVSLLCGQ
jgi:hypothetical protein